MAVTLADWTILALPSLRNWRALGRGPAGFSVLAGTHSAYVPDTGSASEVARADSDFPTSVLFAGGVFHAITEKGAWQEDGSILSSADGLAYTRRPELTDAGNSGGYYRGLAKLGNTLCAAGHYSSAASTDNGASWLYNGTQAVWALSALAAGTDKFVSVGSNVLVALTSTDGLNWTSRALPNPGAAANRNWQAVAHNGALFLAACIGASSGQATLLASSVDGVTWVELPAPWTGSTVSFTPSDLDLVLKANNGVFWLLTRKPSATGTTTNQLFSSADGSTWTTHEVPDQAWTDMAFNGDYMALSANNSAALYVARVVPLAPAGPRLRKTSLVTVTPAVIGQAYKAASTTCLPLAPTGTGGATLPPLSYGGSGSTAPSGVAVAAGTPILLEHKDGNGGYTSTESVAPAPAGYTCRKTMTWVHTPGSIEPSVVYYVVCTEN